MGEITQSNHVLKAKDVYIGKNKRKFQFILFSSKTHGKANHPQIIKIKSTKVGNYMAELDEAHEYLTTWCPYELVNEYQKIRPQYSSKKEQFFVFKDKTPVSPIHFRAVFKSLLKLKKLDLSLYGTHSFRAGRSLDLLDMGVSVETIEKMGRWKSSAVYNYLR